MNCPLPKHKKRDNTFGVSWCIGCGRLFNTFNNQPISLEETQRFNLVLDLMLNTH